MATVEERLVARFRQLAERGRKLFSYTYKNVDSADLDSFYSWQTSSLSASKLAFSESGLHTLRFGTLFMSDHPTNAQVKSGVGVLISAAEDIEGGFLGDQRQSLAAELFDTQIDIAEHLLEQGMFHPAASLVGAILESGLRELATTNSVEISDRESIGSLNQKLLKSGVISRTRYKAIDAWRAIRNHADHGQFNDFGEGEVRSMLVGVRDFIAD